MPSYDKSDIERRMAGAVESLNVSAAAAVALYELARR